MVWGRAGASPGLDSAFVEDEDEDEAFQTPQLFDFDDPQEFDDPDGTHALMVRAQGTGRGLLSWREGTGVQLDNPRHVFSFSEPQFPHLR